MTEQYRRPDTLRIRQLGLMDYREIFQAMKTFTAARVDTTPDELWVLEHLPVFTQGLNGKPEHLLAPGDIPVMQVDRGGQVTYHGPGQLVVYCLLDMQRLKLGVRQLVTLLEQSIITLVAAHGIRAYARPEAPGVYVAGQKIASLGLRIKRGRSYHGLSLNVAMDLEPFSRINPCGYAGLQVTQLSNIGISAGVREIGDDVLRRLVKNLGYTKTSTVNHLPNHLTLGAEHARTESIC